MTEGNENWFEEEFRRGYGDIDVKYNPMSDHEPLTSHPIDPTKYVQRIKKEEEKRIREIEELLKKAKRYRSVLPGLIAGLRDEQDIIEAVAWETKMRKEIHHMTKSEIQEFVKWFEQKFPQYRRADIFRQLTATKKRSRKTTKKPQYPEEPIRRAYYKRGDGGYIIYYNENNKPPKLIKFEVHHRTAVEGVYQLPRAVAISIDLNGWNYLRKVKNVVRLSQITE